MMKMGMNQGSQCNYEFGLFRVDTAKRVLTRDGEVVPLTPKCFEILVALVEEGGEVVTKDALMKKVWADSFVEEGNLTYNMSMLRKALGERAGEHQYIVTVPGRGYQFVETVKEQSIRPVAPDVSSLLPSAVQEKGSNELEADLNRDEQPKSLIDSVVAGVVRDKRSVMIGAAVLVIAGAALSFGLYKLIGGNGSQTNIEPFQRMKITRLTSTGKATVAAISPDGKYVAHATGGNMQSLLLRHIATGSDKEILPPAPCTYPAMTFSPDGNYIYFVRLEARQAWLSRVPVLGGSPQKLVSDVDGCITFSPDGRQMAYIRGYPERNEARLITADIGGAGEQTLLTKPLGDVFSAPSRAWGPAWSPDGAVIAFALRKNDPNGKYWNVMTVRVNDRTEQQLTFHRWSALAHLAWLSDGSGLIVAAEDEGSFQTQQIWRISYPNADVRRITNDTNDYRGVSLAEDSTALLTVETHRNSNVWVTTVGDASHPDQITSKNLEGVLGVSWAPGGRIAYTSGVRGAQNIWIMNADGSAQEQLTVEAGDNSNPSVSLDGRYIVFSSNRTGNTSIWRMDIDGGNAKQLTSGIDVWGADITPDGKWVVYPDVGSGTRTLWKVSIDGGDRVQLTDYYSQGPAVSPNGMQIAFMFLDQSVTPKRLRAAVIPLAGGPPERVFDLPLPIGQAVRWSPDGRALTYIDARDGVHNIWALPLDGSAPQQLTNFKSDRIFAYDWSRDGRRLACARWNQISDVVLIDAIR